MRTIARHKVSHLKDTRKYSGWWSEIMLFFAICSIYPSAHDNSIQIPIGNNTGSLPDLTSVHFPSPLHTPIDQEHDHSSSPYSSVRWVFFSFLSEGPMSRLFMWFIWMLPESGNNVTGNVVTNIDTNTPSKCKCRLFTCAFAWRWKCFQPDTRYHECKYDLNVRSIN